MIRRVSGAFLTNFEVFVNVVTLSWVFDILLLKLIHGLN